MLERLVSLVKRSRNASAQRNHQLLVGPFRTALVSAAVCGWEMVAEANRGNVTARDLVLFLPQLALLLMLGLQLFPRLQQRMHRRVAAATVTMIPVVIVEIVYSSFRLGIGLCCCSRSFCPVTSPAEVSACGLVLDNCYIAFVRKIAHFYGTASLLVPLTTIVSGVTFRWSRQSIGQKHCRNFLDKTRLQ